MIKDTCLGCSAAAGPLLQRFALGVLKNHVLLVAFTSSSSTYNKNATKINTVHNTNIFSFMHECTEYL
jgi:hypothetical protein